MSATTKTSECSEHSLVISDTIGQQPNTTKASSAGKMAISFSVNNLSLKEVFHHPQA